MKKSIIALALIAASGSAVAVTSPADKAGYDLLEQMARTTEGQAMAEQMRNAMESGTDEEKAQFGKDIVEFTKDHDNPIAVMLALDNVNVCNAYSCKNSNQEGDEGRYTSALDQLIEGGWVSLTEEQKAYYDDYQAEKASRRGEYKESGEHLTNNSSLSSAIAYKNNLGSQNGDLHFKATVKPTCGVNVTDANGALNFRDTSDSDLAGFTITTNVQEGATVTLSSVVDEPSVSSFGDISYDIVGINSNLGDGGSFKAGNNEKIELNARVDAHSSMVTAGDHYLDTVITVSCN